MDEHKANTGANRIWTSFLHKTHFKNEKTHSALTRRQTSI